MDSFEYRNGQLWCEHVNLHELAYDAGTPLYVYARRTFEHHYDLLVRAFAPVKPTISFAVRGCANVHVLRLLTERRAGLTVVNGGELHRALAADAAPRRIAFSGNHKVDDDVLTAIEAGVNRFTLASAGEFQTLATRARMIGRQVCATVRLSLDRPYRDDARNERAWQHTLAAAEHLIDVYGRDPHCRIDGIFLDIGRGVRSIGHAADAVRTAVDFATRHTAAGHPLRTLWLGGLPTAHDETGRGPTPAQLADALLPMLEPFCDADDESCIIIEPDRMIAANAGVLLSRIERVTLDRGRKIVSLDASVAHLVDSPHRGAWHFIWPTSIAPMHHPTRRRKKMPNPGLEACDLVGPGPDAEPALARARPLPPIARGDVLAIFGAGAYGMASAAQHQAVPRPAEMLISQRDAQIIRRRETLDDMLTLEELAPSSSAV